MINLCPKRVDYYKQLNNELDPKNACQCTAAAQCLDILGLVSCLKGDYKQPEDNLRAYCNSKPMLDFCVMSHGINWAKSVDHPSEWADVLVRAINDLVGFKCASYKQGITWAVAVERINKELPFICSMRYEKIPGHYVSVVGYTDDGQLIVNDPYKNDLDGSIDGYNNLYSRADWEAHSKQYGIFFERRA